MKKYLQRSIWLAVSLVLLLGLPVSAGAEEFESLSLARMEQLVAENKGKIVMVNFFASWCPPCREEVPSLISIRKDFAEDKLFLIGVSLDEDKKDLQKFVAKMRFNYPVQLAERDLVQAVGVTGIPHMLVFDGTGEIVANEPGLVSEEDLRDFLQKNMGAR